MPDADDRRCDHCGGEAVPSEGGDVPVLECADCGNVLGLAQPDGDDGVEGDAATAPADDAVSTDAVHATDGKLDQLERVVRMRSDAGRIEAERLVLRTETTTIEVTAADDSLDIRLVDEDEAA